MKRILEEFVSKIKKQGEILEAFYLEYPKHFEVIVLVISKSDLNFKKRSLNFSEKFPEMKTYKFIVYTEEEWKTIQTKEISFLKTLEDFGERIFHKKSLSKLTDIFKITDKKNRSELKVDEILNKKWSLQSFASSLEISAREDLLAAKVLFEKGFFRLSVFLCQQSVEKSLKSVLAKFGEKSFKVHNTDSLLELVSKHLPEVEKFSDEIKRLESLYLVTRYPPFGYSAKMGQPITISKGKALHIIELTEEVILLV